MHIKTCIVVAGGKGVRMQTDTPKQFLTLTGKPMVMLTMEAFYRYDPKLKIILVLPEFLFQTWYNLCKKFEFKIPYTVAAGGKTRYNSVKNGLNILHDTGLVAVHDGARPLVSTRLLKRCFETAEKKGNAVPCIPLPVSLRKIGKTGNLSVDRSQYVAVQTPQVFKKELLDAAFQQPYQDNFTDEASMMDHMGIPIHLVQGEPGNIKITTPEDLLFAETLLRKEEIS